MAGSLAIYICFLVILVIDQLLLDMVRCTGPWTEFSVHGAILELGAPDRYRTDLIFEWTVCGPDRRPMDREIRSGPR